MCSERHFYAMQWQGKRACKMAIGNSMSSITLQPCLLTVTMSLGWWSWFLVSVGWCSWFLASTDWCSWFLTSDVGWWSWFLVSVCRLCLRRSVDGSSIWHSSSDTGDGGVSIAAWLSCLVLIDGDWLCAYAVRKAPATNMLSCWAYHIIIIIIIIIIVITITVYFITRRSTVVQNQTLVSITFIEECLVAVNVSMSNRLSFSTRWLICKWSRNHSRAEQSRAGQYWTKLEHSGEQDSEKTVEHQEQDFLMLWKIHNQ